MSCSQEPPSFTTLNWQETSDIFTYKAISKVHWLAFIVSLIQPRFMEEEGSTKEEPSRWDWPIGKSVEISLTAERCRRAQPILDHIISRQTSMGSIWKVVEQASKHCSSMVAALLPVSRFLSWAPFLAVKSLSGKL